MALSGAMPHDTTELREIAAELAEEILRGADDLEGNERDALRATALNNLSNRLADLGRREDALTASEEAVETYRSLAAARPDAFTPVLAMSLNNLSADLGDLGRREDALAASEEAVETYRALAAARPAAFAEPLATSLWVLANRLDELERPIDAIDANHAAIETLAPLFHRHVEALAPRIGAMARGYLKRCERAGARSDESLLEPFANAFSTLRGKNK